MNTMPLKPAQSHRLRIGRHSQAGQIYHLRCGTEERRPLFCDWRAARAVVASLRESEKLGHARTWAFVVMPDHLHWLCTLGEVVTLPHLVNTAKGRATCRLRALGIEGPIWQRGYFDRALRNEESMQQVARYVVANPLRKGLVESIGDYPHWDAAWLD